MHRPLRRVALTLLACGLTGCAHRVSWQVQPAPVYVLPPAPSTALAVVADSRECKPVADALAVTLGARPGVRVSADAPIRLTVSDCDGGQDTTVEIEVGDAWRGGPQAVGDRRRYTLHGWSAAALTVTSPSGNAVVLSGTADRTLRSPWLGAAEAEPPRAATLASDLARGVAQELANQLAPLPVSLRRTLYADAPPGSARDLHNQAVAAEKAGDLVHALALAQRAAELEPCRATSQYLAQLKDHALTVGCALPP